MGIPAKIKNESMENFTIPPYSFNCFLALLMNGNAKRHHCYKYKIKYEKPVLWDLHWECGILLNEKGI